MYLLIGLDSTYLTCQPASLEPTLSSTNGLNFEALCSCNYRTIEDRFVYLKKKKSIHDHHIKNLKYDEKPIRNVELNE